MADAGQAAPERRPEPPRQETQRRPRDEHRGRGRWRAWLLALLALLLLSTAVAYGIWQYRLREQQAAGFAERQRTFVPTLRTAVVKASPSTVSISLPATTLAFTQSNIFARVSGYILKRNVDIGDRVKEDQLLAEISAPEIDHQIAQAEAQLALSRQALVQAEAGRDLAQITWNRDRPLVEKGWASKQQGSVDQQNLKSQEAAVGVARATVNSQESQLNVLRQQQAYKSIKSPFDGIVTQRNVDVGDLVQGDSTGGTFLFTVMQSDVIRAQVFVPQEQARGLAPGVKAVIRVPEIPARDFPGSVTRIAHALDPGSRTLLTEVDVPNPEGLLHPGMYCTVELQIPRKPPSLLVPAQAIIFNRDGLQVAVVEDGTVRIRKISVVRDFGTELEVNDGVKEGDKVILSPPVNLADGGKVATQ